jgi:hypothetical protein
VILASVASVLGAVVLVPVVELVGAGLLGLAFAVDRVAGADFGEGSLGAADRVGSLGGSGRAYLVFAATLRFAGGGVADVFDVGLGRAGMRSGFDGTVGFGPLLCDVVEVVLLADLAVSVLVTVSRTSMPAPCQLFAGHHECCALEVTVASASIR